MDYYKNQLKNNQLVFCDDLCKSLRQFRERIKAPKGLSFDEVTECVTAVKYDHPELFYVDFSEGLYYTYSDHVEYQPRYHYGKDETKKRIVALETLCNKVVKTLVNGRVASLYKKILWVHNMLVRNCVYDHEALKDDSKYQAYTLDRFSFVMF